MSDLSDPALSAALKFLKLAERTESELKTHLESKGFRKEDIDRVVAMMLTKRFVSDERVVEREIELAKGPRKIGREKLAARLESKGLSVDASSAYTLQEETENAIAVIRSRSLTDRQKAGRVLVSRGYSEEALIIALDKEFGDWE